MANKIAVIHIRVTSEQKRKLRAVAHRRGLGLSPWMLVVALEALRREEAKSDRG